MSQAYFAFLEGGKENEERERERKEKRVRKYFAYHAVISTKKEKFHRISWHIGYGV